MASSSAVGSGLLPFVAQLRAIRLIAYTPGSEIIAIPMDSATMVILTSSSAHFTSDYNVFVFSGEDRSNNSTNLLMNYVQINGQFGTPNVFYGGESRMMNSPVVPALPPPLLPLAATLADLAMLWTSIINYRIRKFDPMACGSAPVTRGVNVLDLQGRRLSSSLEPVPLPPTYPHQTSINQSDPQSSN